MYIIIVTIIISPLIMLIGHILSSSSGSTTIL